MCQKFDYIDFKSFYFIKNFIGLDDIVGMSCRSHFAYETKRVIKSQNVKYAWSTIRLLYSLDTNWFSRLFFCIYAKDSLLAPEYPIMIYSMIASIANNEIYKRIKYHI